MSIGTITDTRVKVQLSGRLIEILKENIDCITELPENVANILKKHNCHIQNTVEILSEDSHIQTPSLNVKLLNELLSNKITSNETEVVDFDKKTNRNPEDVSNEGLNKDDKKSTTEIWLYLTDLKWLYNILVKLRKEKGLNIYLSDLIKKCDMELPKNDIIERNPELEARCQKLREQQQNLEYRKMTKNVDPVLKNYPEDTIAYQMKALNSQIIAVLQFVFSVVAGFVFGFLGLEWIIGNLDFGFRLLLGIMCALIIALAEIYFLAKKLNEYDETATTLTSSLGTPKKKPHLD